jgi:magnesium transporter
MLWVDLEDPTDEETGVLGGIFGFHVLSVEDCMRDRQLPRLNRYDSYTFLIVHGLDAKRGDGAVPPRSQPIAVFIGENYVVTYHRKHVNGMFETRGQVAKNPGSLLRTPDWLLHGILEALMEDFEPAVVYLEQELADLRSRLLSRAVPELSEPVCRIGGQLDDLRRVAGLHQDVLRQLDGPERRVILDENRAYFRNIYDRTTRMQQQAEEGRELLSRATEAHRLLVSGRTQGAAVLGAAVGSVTLPLLLVIAYYGIVRTTPGVGWGNLDFAFLGVVVVVVASVLLAFRKKRWL